MLGKPTQATTASQSIAGPGGADRGGCFLGAGFRLQRGTDTEPGALAFVVGLAGCANDDLIEGPVPKLGQWYHLAGTYDGSTMQCLVDGVLVGERSNIDYTPYGRFVAGASCSEYAGGPTSFLAGEIDDSRLWNHVRDETEIASTRFDALEGGETGLSVYWNLDEGTGQIAEEFVTGVLNGRLGDDDDANGDAADPVWVEIVGESPTTLEDLMDAVRSLELNHRHKHHHKHDKKRHDKRHSKAHSKRHKKHLMAKLRVAQRLLRDDRAENDKAAVRALEAFVRSVRRGAKKHMKHMTKAAADELVEMAREVIEGVELVEPAGREKGRGYGKHHGHGDHDGILD